jgi:hypothetical protein
MEGNRAEARQRHAACYVFLSFAGLGENLIDMRMFLRQLQITHSLKQPG